MTATLNGMYNSAPDTPSPVYPDRLIRPLPKRTIRSRLSIDATDSGLCPAAPSSPHVFYGSSVDHGDGVNESKVYVQQGDGLDHALEADIHLHFENGVDLESGDEDGPVVVRRSAGFRGSSLSPSSSAPHPSNGDGAQAKSSAAGPDGYDAFENTNNKKKRKIPTPGNLGGHHSTLSPEFSTMGLANPAQSPSATPGDGSHVSTFYGTGSPASPVASGISGAGRGRLGRNQARNSSGRGQLSVQTQFGWQHGRARRDTGSGDSPGKPDQGIISAAIANAAASALSPPPGAGNVSMLDRQAPTTPTKTQFTFTCESDSSKGMAMQAQHTFSNRSGRYGGRDMSPPSPISPQGHPSQNRAAATMTNTAASANALANATGNATANATTTTATASTSTAEAPNQGRKKKRSPGNIYSVAARQRKIQQQYANLHHPPSMEDIWICEFCEYESIFGHPPEALIRQYEIKDRKERKRLAEKKRLLEKAKMKGRKNKKATKNASKHAAAHPDQGYDRASVDQGSGHPDDEYVGHEYEDEEDPSAPPAPVPPSATFKPPLPPGGPPTTGHGAKGAPTTVSEGRPP